MARPLALGARHLREFESHHSDHAHDRANCDCCNSIKSLGVQSEGVTEICS